MTASYDTIAANSELLDRLSERRCIIHNGVVGLRISARGALSNVEAIFQGPVPRIMEDGRNIHISVPRFRTMMHELCMGSETGWSDLKLPSVSPWDVVIHGGVADLEVDMLESTLNGLTIHGGAVNVDIVLPAPTSRISIDIHGGCNNVRILRPYGTDLGMAIHGGCTGVKLDDRHTAAQGRPFVWLSGPSMNRYDVNIHGGVVDMEVATFRE